jgi:hypothetical protein
MWSAAEIWDIDTQRFYTVGLVLDVAHTHPVIRQAKQTLTDKKLILDSKERPLYFSSHDD